MNKNNERLYQMSWSKIYDLYLMKVTKKDRTKAELDQVICWLTNYDQNTLEKQVNSDVSIKTFFDDASKINDNAVLITGKICGVKIEEIEDPLMKKIRYLDKLVDELAKGRKMESILRK